MKLLSHIDNFLDKYSMFKVVTYSLFILVAVSFASSFLKLSSFSPSQLLLSIVTIFATTTLTQFLFCKIYKYEIKLESTIITSLILYFILAPSIATFDLGFTALTSFLAISSKFIIAYKFRHIFNPVAISLVIGAMLGSTMSIWWVGSPIYLPFVLVSGFLILRKLRLFSLYTSFIATGLITYLIFNIISGVSLSDSLFTYLFNWPALFFLAFMVTEPFTMPGRSMHHIWYGAIAGIASSVPFSIDLGSIEIFSTPELALIFANIFAFSVSMKTRTRMTLLEKRAIAKDFYEFIWKPDDKIAFTAGQYMEWQLPHDSPDQRGTKRYFTISSSPDSPLVSFAVRIVDKPSTYKKALTLLTVNSNKMIASSLKGDFVLPEKHTGDLIFLAGGIGITPFMSMLRSLNSAHKYKITLIYATSDIETTPHFNELQTLRENLKFNIINIYSIPSTNSGQALATSGERALSVNQIQTSPTETIDKISSSLSNIKLSNPMFYISGPPGFVHSVNEMLKNGPHKNTKIIKDFFPGLD